MINSLAINNIILHIQHLVLHLPPNQDFIIYFKWKSMIFNETVSTCRDWLDQSDLIS